MSMLKELIRRIFGEQVEELVLDDRFEFRLSKKEKQLIKKYCELKQISVSQFFRSLAIKEIDTFIKVNNK